LISEEVLTRDRIVQTAFSLFLDFGYENTSVQAIIDAVGIAKGTFYHHFKSKETMLVDLVEGLSRRMAEVIAPIVADPSLDAGQKLVAAARVAVAQKQEDFGPHTLLLVKQMRSKGNRLLADSIDEILSKWILPQYALVIGQGVTEGLFQVRNPDLAADLIVGTIMAMKNRVFDLFIAAAEGDQAALEDLVDLYASIEEAIERILGASAGSLPIYSSIDMKGLLARLTGLTRLPGAKS